MNNKGSVLDLILIIIVLLVLSASVLVGLTMATSFKDQINTMSDMPSSAKDSSNQIVEKFTNTIDSTFLFFTIFLGIATLVLAALVRIHPIFIPFYFIGWVFTIFLSGIFSNIYQEMSANSELAAAAAELTLINSIMVGLPIIVGLLGTILMIVMYKLWSASQEGF